MTDQTQPAGRNFRFRRASEVFDSTPEDFAPWVLDTEYLVLRIEGVRKPMLNLDGADYEVDLEECLTSAQMLDWIMQVSGKVWATDEIVGALVRALAVTLNPQANLCSFGKSTSIPKASVRALVTKAARPPRYADMAAVLEEMGVYHPDGAA